MPHRRSSTRRCGRCWPRPRTRSTEPGPRTPMSDHISGPRALADPIADITDFYAFPSPDRPDHLVLVMNTLPFAQPSDGLSDGLVYRFRLRPLTAATPDSPVPFTVASEEFVVDCVFSPPSPAAVGP